MHDVGVLGELCDNVANVGGVFFLYGFVALLVAVFFQGETHFSKAGSFGEAWVTKHFTYAVARAALCKRLTPRYLIG